MVLFCMAWSAAQAQFRIGTKAAREDSTSSGFRTLQLDEVNFVSSYYQQNGNHSAVTGGIGTEKLYDIAKE
jgi:hypothetical protein